MGESSEDGDGQEVLWAGFAQALLVFPAPLRHPTHPCSPPFANPFLTMSVLAPYKEIASKLSGQYEKAKVSGDLFAYDSTVEHVEEDGIRVSASVSRLARPADDQDFDPCLALLQFEVRVCPALKAKHDASTAVTASADVDKPTPAPKRVKPDDPFEGPYESDLLVGRVGQEEGGEKMVALLNKFSVVPGALTAPTNETPRRTLGLTCRSMHYT